MCVVEYGTRLKGCKTVTCGDPSRTLLHHTHGMNNASCGETRKSSGCSSLCIAEAEGVASEEGPVVG